MFLSRCDVDAAGPIYRKGIGFSGLFNDIAQRRGAAIPPRRYRAIVVDGIYLRFRRSVTQGAGKGVLLVAVGVREDGGFEVFGLAARFGGNQRRL